MIGQSSVFANPMHPDCSYVMSPGSVRCYAWQTQIISKRFASYTEKGGRNSWEKQIRKTSLTIQKNIYCATWNIDFDVISNVFLHRNGQVVWIQAFWNYCFALLLSHTFFIRFIGLLVYYTHVFYQYNSWTYFWQCH